MTSFHKLCFHATEALVTPRRREHGSVFTCVWSCLLFIPWTHRTLVPIHLNYWIYTQVEPVHEAEYNIGSWDFVAPSAVTEEYMASMYQVVSLF